VFLIPPLIANEGGAPHFLRSLGLAPYVAACIGLGCVEAIAIRAAAGSALRWIAEVADPDRLDRLRQSRSRGWESHRR